MAGFSVSKEEALVNRIKSAYRTLDNYRRTSTMTHGRLTESVTLYAAARGTEVEEIAREYPDMLQVQRWAVKYREYCEQYGLCE